MVVALHVLRSVMSMETLSSSSQYHIQPTITRRDQKRISAANNKVDELDYCMQNICHFSIMAHKNKGLKTTTQKLGDANLEQ